MATNLFMIIIPRNIFKMLKLHVLPAMFPKSPIFYLFYSHIPALLSGSLFFYPHISYWLISQIDFSLFCNNNTTSIALTTSY